MDKFPVAVEKHFEDIERVAEEVISDQQEIITLDKRRNLNREALRQLKTNPKCQESSQSLVCVGNMFMRLPRHSVIKNIEKEQENCGNEIKNLRDGLREKVDQLRTLEGKRLSRGSGLKALSEDEWRGVKQVLGQ